MITFFIILYVLLSFISSKCIDLPDWSDIAGETCSIYIKKQYCKSNTLGPGWDSSFGDISDYAFNEISALQACCDCGGGRTIISQNITEKNNHKRFKDINKICVDISDWKDIIGYTCDQYRELNYCTPNGKPGSGWKLTFGKIVDFANNGFDAFHACCDCGRELKIEEKLKSTKKENHCYSINCEKIIGSGGQCINESITCVCNNGQYDLKLGRCNENLVNEIECDVIKWLEHGMGDTETCLMQLERGKRIAEKMVRSKHGVLFFKHVHKAAGTSLCKLASKNTKVHFRTFTLGNQQWDNNCTPYEFGACAIGHMSVSQQRQLLYDYQDYFLASEGPMPDDLLIDKNGAMGMAWITVLRHPWERVISTFIYWKSLTKILTSGTKSPKQNNTNIPNAALCNRYYVRENASFFEWIKLYPDNWMVRALAGHSVFWKDSEITRSDLNRALRRLQIFSIVGVMPLIQESLSLTHYLFGWRNADINKFHINSKKHASTDKFLKRVPRARKILMKKYALDLELYIVAKKIAEKQIDKINFS